MNRWLDPIRQALDERSDPVTVFCRDDDAGWDDQRLLALLDRFRGLGLPLDLAVIPEALSRPMARILDRRVRESAGLLRVHQHGWSHQNHETEGRPAEFGACRTRDRQQEDIAAGQRRLDELGLEADPIFTPPWNRCTTATGECLIDLGFQALSRDLTATRLDLPRLIELPVSFDWFQRRKGRALGLEERMQLLAQRLGGSGPIGLMFHHAVTEPADLDRIGDLMALMAAHHRVRAVSMLALTLAEQVGCGASH